jgi:ribosome-binding factor A
MKRDRLVRVNEQMKREIGASLFRLFDADRDGIDLSAVTITHVMTSSNLRSARVLVSIRDHESERGRYLSVLTNHRAQIQEQIARHMGLKYTPRLAFELDLSIQDGDRILSLLSELPVGDSEGSGVEDS